MSKIGVITNSVIGCAGAAIAGLYGGWTAAMTTLLIFMIVDYLTGVACAVIFKKSPKTDEGAYDSKMGFKGLAKKGGILLVVLVAARLDTTLETNFVRDAVIIGFIVNETMSIIENLGLMGVPIPKALKKAIELLRTKEDDTENKSDDETDKKDGDKE